MPTELQMIEDGLVIEAMDVARIGLCVTDDEGRILMMTPRFAGNFHLDALDFLGRNVRTILSESILIPRFEALISTQEGDVYVEVPYSHDERVTIMVVQARTMRRQSTGTFRVITALDMADFGAASSHLSETRRRLDSLNSGVVVADCRLPDMPIVLVNSRFRAITGYPPDEVIGRNCRFLQGDDRHQPGCDALRDAIANGRSGYAVLRNYRRNGESFLNELLVSPMRDADGALTHYVALQRELPSPR